MKIALATHEGKTISKHFGRAPYYLVVTIENGIEVARELRDKVNHTHFAGEPHEEVGGRHGFGAQEQNRHFQMADAISDCEVLICGGMGRGAQINLAERGIKTILTDVNAIDAALKAYVEGHLIDQSAQLLH